METRSPSSGVGKAEAAEALGAASSAQRRSASLYAYRFHAPVMMLWGALWIATNLVIAFAPVDPGANWAWAVSGWAGVIATAGYYWRHSRNWGRSATGARSRQTFWRLAAAALIGAEFIVAVTYVMRPEWREVHAFFGLVYALVWSCLGVWAGWRLIAVGLGVGAASIFGFLWLPDQAFLAFMALVCGGGLFAGGLWLRTA